MFTGIIEVTGTITDIYRSGSNCTFWVKSPLGDQVKVDQSISHNGVCLTVEEIKNQIHRVTAIEETLQKTNLGSLSVGNVINLERCMIMNGRVDGHIVQGHVDTTGICRLITNKNGSWEYIIDIDPAFAGLIIEKGSVSLNGISLTTFNVTENSFTVAIIPYTYNHTNIHLLNQGDKINIEFDMIGKYVQRLQSLQKAVK